MLTDKDTIRSFIQIDILNDPDASILDNQDLLLSGLLDSLNVLRLVNFLEQENSISIAPEDVLIEHFGSLDQIEAYLANRVSQSE